MATRRMIHNKISRSEQVNNLTYKAALLFTWMITHADDEGRIKGGATSIRGTVFPLRELKDNEVEEMLCEIQRQGLIHRWKDNNGTYIEFPTWYDHQTLQKDRTKPSKIPAYSREDSMMDTESFQNDSTLETQDNVNENKSTEVNEIEKNGKERESGGEPTPDPKTYSPIGYAEHQAKRAWSIFKDTPDVFLSRYLSVARAGIRWSIISAITNEINQDDTIINKGKEFEKRSQKLLNKTSTEKE